MKNLNNDPANLTCQCVTLLWYFGLYRCLMREIMPGGVYVNQRGGCGRTPGLVISVRGCADLSPRPPLPGGEGEQNQVNARGSQFPLPPGEGGKGVGLEKAGPRETGAELHDWMFLNALGKK